MDSELDKVVSGTHYICDVWVDDSERIQNLDEVRSIIDRELKELSTLNSVWHDFGSGFGVTGVVLLAESHFSIHTWPEHKFFSMDLYTCGPCDGDAIVTSICSRFGANKYDMVRVDRPKNFPV